MNEMDLSLNSKIVISRCITIQVDNQKAGCISSVRELERHGTALNPHLLHFLVTNTNGTSASVAEQQGYFVH